MSKETALITGASSGIGLHLADEFARHQHPIVLVAPVEAELVEIARQLKNSHGIEARTIAADLEEPDAPQRLFEALKAEGIEIDILVNNAGHGQRGRYWEVPIEKHLSILRLNVEAPLRLTSLFLPTFISRRQGRILNTASVAGFMPGPLIAVYHATKAFVLSWSEALATEVEGTGVTVTALCPGPTDTDFFMKSEMEDATIVHKGHVMAPQDVASAGYKALMAGERVIVTGFINKALVFSRHLMTESAQATLNKKQYESVPPEEETLHRGDKERAAAHA